MSSTKLKPVVSFEKVEFKYFNSDENIFVDLNIQFGEANILLLGLMVLVKAHC